MASERARQLRRNSTDAEGRLWNALRSRQLANYKFRRQRPIGPFIADFVCIAHKLVIELDGSQHLDSTYDAGRTKWLEEHGWRVLRFWNNDVLLNTEGVAHAILNELAAGTTLTRPQADACGHPLPQAGEG
jgi:very-short-patch-repair endonuclease